MYVISNISPLEVLIYAIVMYIADILILRILYPEIIQKVRERELLFEWNMVRLVMEIMLSRGFSLGYSLKTILTIVSPRLREKIISDLNRYIINLSGANNKELNTKWKKSYNNIISYLVGCCYGEIGHNIKYGIQKLSYSIAKFEISVNNLDEILSLMLFVLFFMPTILLQMIFILNKYTLLLFFPIQQIFVSLWLRNKAKGIEGFNIEDIKASRPFLV